MSPRTPVDHPPPPGPGRAAAPAAARGRALRLSACVALLAVLAVGTGLLLARAHAVATTPAPLRLAMNPWPGYEFATLAQVKGFFADEGVDVKLLELSSLHDARRAYERGQADGFFGTIAEVILAEAAGPRLPRVVLVIDYSDGADVVLATPGVASLSDLRGRRVALERGSLTSFVLGRALEQAGLTWDDIEHVHMPLLDAPAALADGRVDAAVAYPPVSLKITDAGTARAIFSTTDIPGEVLDVLAVDQRVWEARRGDVDAVCRAFFRAVAYAEANPAEAYAIMAAREGISPAVFAAALEQGVRMIRAEEQDAFLGDGGHLGRITEVTRRVLRDAGELPAGDHGVLTPAE
jgi:NitT/TauT family transport system substrate-binding protein